MATLDNQFIERWVLLSLETIHKRRVSRYRRGQFYDGGVLTFAFYFVVRVKSKISGERLPLFFIELS